ncbi:hypothetical protein PIB30_058875 [Stylosanthes scabra]|uniref:Uncharacterized protein n=1 Tax=Stylosanthes scabra TaxID=79078 RepID=A0ABU6VIK6_9FABA|nr:hypothetical protein [Stylosanthes scabra]
MEEFKVEEISREDIKPSSPTPSHLRTFKHSILDQANLFHYGPVVVFYISHNLSEFPKRLELLKQSLSETLTHFYPLGGRIKDDFSIDCNDEGANFVVAKVNCPIAKFLSKPDIYSLEKFLPISFLHETSIGDHVTNIQVNVFDCGGIAIGFCISHRITDGASFSIFIKAWTERASYNHNSEPLAKPNFATISLFPAATSHFREISNQPIATLKAQILAKSSADPSKNHPSHVQIVSALLWKCFMVASKAQFGTQRPSLVNHTVNLRQLMEKSLHPENSIGNFLWCCTAEHTGEHELSLDDLVSKLKNSIQQVDKDLAARFQRYDDASSIVEDDVRNLGRKTRGDAFETLFFSSWYNFGVYDTDFGWGKPIWGGPIDLRNTLMCMNTIVLVHTKFRDGIEAWVTLEEEKMKHLESCPELLTYATPDPSPLTMGSTGSNSKL